MPTAQELRAAPLRCASRICARSEDLKDLSFYDAAAWLASATQDGVTTNYSYDATGQLIQAGAQGFGWDANGNPTSGGAQAGPGNRLVTDGTWIYSYDAAGNVTSRSDRGAGLTWSYSYDAANQLTGATEKDGTGGVLVSAAYGYDAFGNRVRMQLAQGGSTQVTLPAFVAQGTPQVGADLTAWRLYADQDGSGLAQTRYLSGEQPNQWLARVDASAGARWLLGDRQGSVSVVAGADGAVLDRISYGPFGSVTAETSPAAGGRVKIGRAHV